MTRSCAVCGSEDFVCMDGFYYCSVCNVQSVQHEQQVEEEIENLDLSMVSEIRGSKAKSEEERMLHPQLPYERDLRNYTAILKCQIDALISFGFAPIIKKSAKVLWIQMVRQAIKDADVNDSELSKNQRTVEGDSAVQSNEAEATASGQSSTENESMLKSQKAVQSLFRPITTLAVCWFACRSCGYKILISDVCLLVRQRLLPFYTDTFPDEVRESAFGDRSFGNKIRSLSHVYWKFCLISRTFNFLENTMPMEAEEMIARFSLDLNLPGEIFQTAVDVLRRLDISKVVNLHDDALPKFTSQRMPIPLEMKAMCIIIIALKGLFKLNDCHEQEMALEALRRYENKDIEDGRLPFLFPCWLLHNELKMAIMEGSSVEEVLSPAWFDCNAKIVNRVMVEFYTVSHLRRRDHIKNHVLGDIFQSASYSFGRIGPEPFSFRSMPRRFESLLVKHSPALDRDTVALFCFDFASTFVADCPEFPDGKNYGFYPLISHSSSDNRSYQFKHMSLTIFSASFNRVLELFSRIRLVTTCSASKALSPLAIGMWNVALSRAELFLNKVSSCETEKKRLSHAILRNISEQGYSSWEEVVMVIAQEMNVEVNQSLRDNLNEYRRSALESSSAMSQAQQFQLHWIFHCENNLSEWPTVASKQPIWSKPLSLFVSNLNGYKVFVNSASFTFFIFVCTLSYLTDNTLCVQLLRAVGFLLAYFNSVLYTCFLAHLIACQRIRSAWQNWLNLFLTEKELETVQVPMDKAQNGRLRTTMLLFAFHHFMLVFFGDAVPVVMSSMTLLSLVMLTLIANELPSQWRLYLLAESVLIFLLGHVKIADVLQLSASQSYLLRCSTTSFAVALSLCGTLLGKIFSFSSLRQCSILSITLWQVWLFTLMAQLDQTVGHRLHWLFYLPCFAILLVFLLWMTSTISWELIAKVFLSMAIVFIAVRRTGAVDLEEKVSDLTWSAFESQCGSSLLSMDNRIIAQEKCSALRGTIVQWKGIVHTVQIYSLPPDSKNVMLGHWLTDLLCDAGECNEENKSVYEIEISGPWGEHVISSAKGNAYLMAVGSFRPFIVYLREGDVIQFRASFTDCLGKYPPRLNLLNIKCISCGKELHDALNDNSFPSRLEASDHLFLRFASLLLLLALIVV